VVLDRGNLPKLLGTKLLNCDTRLHVLASNLGTRVRHLKRAQKMDPLFTPERVHKRVVRRVKTGSWGRTVKSSLRRALPLPLFLKRDRHSQKGRFLKTDWERCPLLRPLSHS